MENCFCKINQFKMKKRKKIISCCYNLEQDLEICMLYEFPLLPGALEFCESQPMSKPRVALAGAQTRRHLGFLEFSVRCCQEASDATYFSQARSLSGSLAQPPGRLQTDWCLSTEGAPGESNLRIPEQDGATQRLSHEVAQ